MKDIDKVHAIQFRTSQFPYQVVKEWNDNYKDRKIVSEFIKDGVLGDKRLSSVLFESCDAIGKKRLASMPDRLTNTIAVSGGQSLKVF